MTGLVLVVIVVKMMVVGCGRCGENQRFSGCGVWCKMTGLMVVFNVMKLMGLMVVDDAVKMTGLVVLMNVVKRKP